MRALCGKETTLDGLRCMRPIGHAGMCDWNIKSDSHPPSAKRPNLGELREQLVKWLHAKRQIWEQNKADDAETCIDCCNEIDINILPIIEQREREARDKALDEAAKAAEFSKEGYVPGAGAASVRAKEAGRIAEHIRKLKSQPKIQAGEGSKS